MIPRRVVRELERQLTREPGNLTVRVTLAAAYREQGRAADAVEQYRLVGGAYFHDGRLEEALSACASALAMAPADQELQALHGRVRAAQAAAPAPPRRAPAAPTGTGARAAVRPVERGPGASASDLETPLPPPMPLHEAAGDSLVGLPRGVDRGAITPPPGAPLPPSPSPLASGPAPLPPAPSSPSPGATLLGPGLGSSPTRALPSIGPLPRLSALPSPQPRPSALPARPVERTTRRMMRAEGPSLDPADDPASAGFDEPADELGLGGGPGGAPGPDDLGAGFAVDDLDLLDVALPVVALTQVRRAGHPPSDPAAAGDLASEVATRRRPKISPHELDLLDLEMLVASPVPVPAAAPPPTAAATDLGDRALAAPALPADPPGPTAAPPSEATDGPAVPTAPVAAAAALPVAVAPAVAGSLDPGDFVDDEPTEPPAAGAGPPIHVGADPLRAGPTDDGPSGIPAAVGELGPGDGDSGTFAGGFTGTLAELAPDGTALDGPLGVFSILPAEAAHELGRRAVVKLYDPGELVVREGDVGDACYVIVRGEVVVTRHGAEGEGEVELARLGEGALFGEFALLADRRRHATVSALGEAEIYVVPRRLLRELAAVFPDVGPALERFYRERLLANLIHTSSLFARLAVDQRAGLLTAFEPMRVESGQFIVRQGEPAGGLFLIVLGAVEVVCRTDDRRAVVLATLGEGAYVGEISLLTGDVATASVVACGPVELAALPAPAFYRVVSEYPELWVAMRDEADARRLHTARVLSGRTAVV